jgi:ribonuclease HI
VEDKDYEITLMVDGGSRGNPGPAAIGAIILQNGREADRVSEFIGEATNNEAEYTALVEGLKKARGLAGKSIHVKADSMLIVKQLLGHYKIKSPNIRPLHAEATALLKEYGSVGIEHIPRELNAEADALVNAALDAATGKVKKKRPMSAKDEPCPKAPGPGPIVSLLTDYGLAGPDAAIAKGKIKNTCPGADVLEISHLVEQNNTRAASGLLEQAVEHIKAAVHLVLVGVSAVETREGLVIQTERGDYMVGPDNGVLLAAAGRLGGIASMYALDASVDLAETAAALAAGGNPGELGNDHKTGQPAPLSA